MSVSRFVLPLLVALTFTAPALAGKTLEVGETKTYKTPSAAIAAAADGDKVLIDPGEYFDCSIVAANDLTIEGTAVDGSAIMTDKACGGKAILVTQGDNITIRNLTLTRARVPDGNGAGIRAEGNGLLIERVKFLNNQNGILAAPNPQGTITIRDSDFRRNGDCNPSCAHGVYVNALKLLRIEKSRFSDTRRAHHIKSRALRTEVIGCEIIDGPTGTASYLIEVPNGGTLIVQNSTMEKGPKAENRSTAIVIGAEGVTQPTREITITNNIFRNAGTYQTTFVTNLTATEAVLKGNKITGKVEPLRGDGEVVQ